jgi:tryptophanase
MAKLQPEPWRVKVVEPIRRIGPAQRDECLRRAGYNVFGIPSEDIYIDLLTDSGTSAMSDAQWGGLMRGDESYAGGRNYYHFEDTVREIFGLPHVIPTHQGRVAENLLFSTVLKPGDVVPDNTHFDTTRANIEVNGGTALDLVIPGGQGREGPPSVQGQHGPRKARSVLEGAPRSRSARHADPDEQFGRRPAGLARECSRHARGLPPPRHPALDRCVPVRRERLVHSRARGRAGWPTGRQDRPGRFCRGRRLHDERQKDGLANIGGFLALRDEAWVEKLKNKLILIEGFPTYGGLAGRDLEAVSLGLKEVLQEDYLAFRVGQVGAFGEALASGGVPVVEPIGGHAVYIDARAFAPHLLAEQYPAQALTIALYREGGIHAVEIDAVMFGRPDPAEPGREILPDLDLVRLAVPRRVYTNTHLEYVTEVVLSLHREPKALHGVRIVHQAAVLRHFTARFELL